MNYEPFLKQFKEERDALNIVIEKITDLQNRNPVIIGATKESGTIGKRESGVLTFEKPAILTSDAKWDGTFQDWLKFKNIKLKKNDKRKSKFYQRYRYAQKKK